MKTVVMLIAALVLACPLARAAGDAPSPAPRNPRNPDYDAGKKAVEAQNWKGALDSFNRALEREPNSADVHNYLGYTYRHMGNFDMAFKHYDTALRIDPKHKGALEYSGEAYLLVNNLPKAEENLSRLDKACMFSCEEYRDLREAIEDYKKKHPGAK
jgi:tetratricopeptide (TPR) repeat protein